MTRFRIPDRLKAATPQIAALLFVFIADRIAFSGFFTVTTHDGRLYGALIDVLVRGAPVGILAIGMSLVIATKGVDLSVGAVIAISGAVAATMAEAHQPLILIVLASLGVGLICGLWNGILVAAFDVQPIIATLILMVAGRGVAQLITGGSIMTFNDPDLEAFSSANIAYLPMPVVITLGLLLLVFLLVRKTALGLLIESVGTNRRASLYAGINAPIIILVAYAVSGLCASVAGLIVCANIRGADSNNAGLWMELDAILAVVIGGTSLLGGRFSVVLSLVGAIIIQGINAGILLSGFPPELNLIVKAVVIVSILILQSPTIRVWLSLFALPGFRK